jgi:hypothetical protein
MYLRKMGSVSLLTREGEVEIAKRIEQGEVRVNSAILDSPIAVREIIDLGEKLKKHKIRVKEIIKDAEADDQEFDEEEADRRIIRLIEKVKRLDKKKLDLLDEKKAGAKSDARKKQIDTEVDQTTNELVQTLEDMRLNKKTIDKIVQKLKGLIMKVERAEIGVRVPDRVTQLVHAPRLERVLTRVPIGAGSGRHAPCRSSNASCPRTPSLTWPPTSISTAADERSRWRARCRRRPCWTSSTPPGCAGAVAPGSRPAASGGPSSPARPRRCRRPWW